MTGTAEVQLAAILVDAVGFDEVNPDPTFDYTDPDPYLFSNFPYCTYSEENRMRHNTWG